MSNTWGENVKLTVFGESHGPVIGAVLDGLPAGETIDWNEVKREIGRRAPGKSSLTTARSETDSFTVESGFYNNHTTGTPLCVVMKNENCRSGDYEELQYLMRPGHADYAGTIRYKGHNDYRGSGHFSGRLTAPLVFAGAVAKQLLRQRGIVVGAHVLQIGSIVDMPFNPLGEKVERLQALTAETLPVLDVAKAPLMEREIAAAKEAGDSVGGTIETMITGIPAGYGNPFFDPVESRLSHMLFSVPAVKGVSFGDGFELAAMGGSESNDAFYYDTDGNVKTRTNHNGGLNGGITNGMPITFKAVIKATASIAKAQETINIKTKEGAVLSVKGRHDPCIVLRALPVIEGAAAWTILDILLTQQS